MAYFLWTTLYVLIVNCLNVNEAPNILKFIVRHVENKNYTCQIILRHMPQSYPSP